MAAHTFMDGVKDALHHLGHKPQVEQPAPILTAAPGPHPLTQRSNPMSVVATLGKDQSIIGTGIKKVSTFLGKLLQAEAKLAPEQAQAVLTIVQDTETFLATASSAVAGDGLNFAADTVTYAAFLQLVADFQACAPIIQQTVQTIESKEPPVTASLPRPVEDAPATT